MHISKGTILVIGGLKYIKNHVKSLKYVQKQGAIPKSRVCEKMQNRELSSGRSLDIYINSWQWRMRSRGYRRTHAHEILHMLNNALNMFPLIFLSLLG